MFCSECGKEIDDSCKFCHYCGSSVNKTDNVQHKAFFANSETVPDDREITGAGDVSIVSTESQTSSYSTVNSQTDFVKKKLNPWKIIVPIVILCIVAAIGVFLYNGYKIDRIYATYNGPTITGTVIDNENSCIVVKGVRKNGKEAEIEEWAVKESVTLSWGKKSSLTIQAAEKEAIVTVIGTPNENEAEDAALKHAKQEMDMILTGWDEYRTKDYKVIAHDDYLRYIVSCTLYIPYSGIMDTEYLGIQLSQSDTADYSVSPHIANTERGYYSVETILAEINWLSVWNQKPEAWID